MENVAQKTEKAIPGAIKIDEKEIRDHLDGLVRQIKLKCRCAFVKYSVPSQNSGHYP